MSAQVVQITETGYLTYIREHFIRKKMKEKPKHCMQNVREKSF